MRPLSSGRILGWLVGVVAVGTCAGVQAGDGPSEEALARVGLKRTGPIFILESEAEVHAKADAVRHLSRELKDSIARQRTTLSEKEYQATIKELNDEINQFKAEMNATNQVINRLPRGRRGYPANNIVGEEQVELNYYKTQLQAEINWRTNSLNQLKSKPFDPKARIQADNDVRTHQESLQQGAQDLRKLVDAANEKYAALAKEPQVKKWLDTPEGQVGVKPKLGPSRAFHLDVKMLEQIERSSTAAAAASADPFASPAKAVRKGRRAKAKHATGAGGSASPF